MLRLDPVSRATWERFHSGRLEESAVAADPVLARWARAAALGARADGPAFPVGATDAEIQERRARVESLLSAPRRESEQGAVRFDLGRGKRIAIFADKDGVIVSARAQEFERGAVRSRLLEGAAWSEDTRGTNAIGTALRERRSVAVIGRAHYERTNQALFCYATPIVDPWGEVLGVFDVSGDLADDDPLLATAVECFGRAIEERLRSQAYASAVAGGLAVAMRMLERCAMPALLIEAPGIVRGANDRALVGLGAQPGATVESVFGVSFDELAAEALGRGAPRFETARARYSLSLDPIMGPDRRVLSVLAYFDPLPRLAPARLATPAPAEAESPAFAAIVGTDPSVVRAKALARRFAKAPVPVLLLAETGTGKELLARAIHAASPRERGPFVAINCGAVSEALLESELFGFAPGSFTGARAAGHEGKLGAANGGTLFLDEVGEMTPALQAMLLRALEDGTYCRVGETQPRKSDFRLVCATCRDLPAMVADGRFRSDLFYRIHGATLTLPPVREREDRLHLARALLDELAREAGRPAPLLAEDAIAHVEDHAWPGNVRELKSALRHALWLAEDGVIDASAFPEVLITPAAPPSRGGAGGVKSRRDAELDALEAALAAAHGNLSDAARRLGVSRSTLYRMMQRRG